MVSSELAELIRSKKAQYCRYLDTKQWSSLEALALPDAKLSFLNPDGSIQQSGVFSFNYHSPKDFTRDIGALFKSASTLHHVGIGELTEAPNGDIEVIWSMEDQILYPSILGLVPLDIRGGGYYHEVWTLRDGDWKLKTLRLERTYMKSSLAVQLFSPLSTRITRFLMDKVCPFPRTLFHYIMSRSKC